MNRIFDDFLYYAWARARVILGAADFFSKFPLKNQIWEGVNNGKEERKEK